MISVNPRCLLPPFVIEENAKTHLEITENNFFFSVQVHILPVVGHLFYLSSEKNLILPISYL